MEGCFFKMDRVDALCVVESITLLFVTAVIAPYYCNGTDQDSAIDCEISRLVRVKNERECLMASTTTATIFMMTIIMNIAATMLNFVTPKCGWCYLTELCQELHASFSVKINVVCCQKTKLVLQLNSTN